MWGVKCFKEIEMEIQGFELTIDLLIILLEDPHVTLGRHNVAGEFGSYSLVFHVTNFEVLKGKQIKQLHSNESDQPT